MCLEGGLWDTSCLLLLGHKASKQFCSAMHFWHDVLPHHRPTAVEPERDWAIGSREPGFSLQIDD